jgi:hypothetical protein
LATAEPAKWALARAAKAKWRIDDMMKAPGILGVLAFSYG